MIGILSHPALALSVKTGIAVSRNTISSPDVHIPVRATMAITSSWRWGPWVAPIIPESAWRARSRSIRPGRNEGCASRVHCRIGQRKTLSGALVRLWRCGSGWRDHIFARRSTIEVWASSVQGQPVSIPVAREELCSTAKGIDTVPVTIAIKGRPIGWPFKISDV